MNEFINNGIGVPVAGRVLLAEDNEINAEIAKIQLKDINMEVDWVRNGAAALETFGESNENYYDVILMDIMMPIMDGYEAIRLIRNLDRQDAERIPIIAISANGFSGVSSDARDSAISCFISKPYNKKELQGTVINLLEKSIAAV